MNIKEFKSYLQKGRGRCVQVLLYEEDIEKYRKTVLWGCLHALPYDEQSEGSRADYVYSLITCYEDTEYFLAPIIDAFNVLPNKRDTLFSHLAGLLACFAKSGNADALFALWKKYGELLSELIKKTDFRGYDHGRDNLELLCVLLNDIGGAENLVRTVEGIGMLLKKNAEYTVDDFDWLLFSAEYGFKGLRKMLKREAMHNEYVAFFYESYLEKEKAEKELFTVVKDNSQKEAASVENITKAIGSRISFAKNATPEQLEQLAEEILKESDPDKRAWLLSIFELRSLPFPHSHERLIEYSLSDNKVLAETALGVLANCRSDAVREYALKLLSEGKARDKALQMLIACYEPRLKKLLLEELGKLCFDPAERLDWHAVTLQILHSDRLGVSLPKEFYIYVYENTLCSHCRASAFKRLARHRQLTRSMIEECRYDSNKGLAEYVNRYYPSRA